MWPVRHHMYIRAPVNRLVQMIKLGFQHSPAAKSRAERCLANDGGVFDSGQNLLTTQSRHPTRLDALARDIEIEHHRTSVVVGLQQPRKKER